MSGTSSPRFPVAPGPQSTTRDRSGFQKKVPFFRPWPCRRDISNAEIRPLPAAPGSGVRAPDRSDGAGRRHQWRRYHPPLRRGPSLPPSHSPCRCPVCPNSSVRKWPLRIADVLKGGVAGGGSPSHPHHQGGWGGGRLFSTSWFPIQKSGRGPRRGPPLPPSLAFTTTDPPCRWGEGGPHSPPPPLVMGVDYGVPTGIMRMDGVPTPPMSLAPLSWWPPVPPNSPHPLRSPLHLFDSAVAPRSTGKRANAQGGGESLSSSRWLKPLPRRGSPSCFTSLNTCTLVRL